MPPTPWDEEIEAHESAKKTANEMPEWVHGLVWNTPRKGKPTLVPNLANTVAVLENDPAFAGKLRFDEFAHTVVPTGLLPFARTPGHWSDIDDKQITIWLQNTWPYRLRIGPDVAAQAVAVVANRNRFNSLQEDLNAKAKIWDGVPRLDSWLTTYLGAPSNDYTRAVGAAWMLAGAARGLMPGCKVDTMLVLEGDQGAKKSTALSILGGERYTDEIADFGSKDAAMQLQGVHVLEIAELDKMHSAEVSRVKAFLTKTFDRYVPKWGMHAIKIPRSCIFAGTVNDNSWNRDATGGRRFWPVEVSSVDADALRRDVDQLWSEAAHRVQRGEHWWLEDSAVVALAKEEQAARAIGDAWDGEIETFIVGRPSVSIAEVLEHLFRDDTASKNLTKWGQVEQNRVARSLTRLGWERRRDHRADAAGRRPWRYFPRPSPGASVPVPNGQLGHAGPLENKLRPTVPVCPSRYVMGGREEGGQEGSNRQGGNSCPSGTTGTLGQPEDFDPDLFDLGAT